MARQYKVKSTNDWRPVPGETITARVLAKDNVMVGNKARAFLIVDTGDTIWRVFQSASLDDVFRTVQRGDYVDLTFLGIAQLKNGNTFKRFKSAVYTMDDDDAGAIPLTTAPKRRAASDDGAAPVKRARRVRKDKA